MQQRLSHPIKINFSPSTKFPKFKYKFLYIEFSENLIYFSKKRYIYFLIQPFLHLVFKKRI